MRRLFLILTAFTLAIFGGVATTPTIAHAAPPTCTSTPTTWAGLYSEMFGTGDAIQPRVVCLGADLVGGSNQNLKIAHTQYVVLDLNGHSLTITGGTAGAGIDTNVDGHLSIQDSSPGSNSLTVNGGPNSAGIGGTSSSGSFITINSGTINSTGGQYGAGIGGGDHGAGGNITINSGNITSTGGKWAAGVGGGYSASGGNITINSGSTTSNGGLWAAGIGGGYSASGGNITINSGNITTIGGYNGSGMGGGNLGDGGDITINAGNINSTSGDWGAGIGGGNNGVGGNITINSGDINSTGGFWGTGIGGGFSGAGGVFIFSGGHIQANTLDGMSATIGGGAYATSGGSLFILTKNLSTWTTNQAGTYGIAPSTLNSAPTPSALAVSVTQNTFNFVTTFSFNYAVNFDTGGGSSVAQQEVPYGSRPTLPTAPTRAGYAMDTWHTSSASGPTYNFSTGTTISAATTLYASWGLLDTTCGSATKPTTWAALAGSFSSATSSNSSSGNPKVICLGADISTTGTHLTIATGAYVTLDLNGHSLSINGESEHAAIETTLAYFTVQDAQPGSNLLTARGGSSGAGIGGGNGRSGGTVTINGGNIFAAGGDSGAGIGGGRYSSGGSFTITNGTVVAAGGVDAAGIGGGLLGNGGSITITGGDVSARGGIWGAGIGGGHSGNGGNVSLKGGRIQAARWTDFSALIGSGAYGSQEGSLTVTTVNSTSWTNTNIHGSSGLAPTTSSTTTSNSAAAISVSRTEVNDAVTFTFNYAVSFNTGGGSNVSQQEVGYGSRPAQPSAPTRAGYAMDTWHTTSASGPSYDFSAGTPITAATTLYASWSAITAAPLSINAGTRAVTITQTDRQVGSAWNVSVHSTPVTLGSGVTDGSAALIYSGTIPSVSAGVHHVEVSSTSTSNVAGVQKLWFVCDTSDTIIGVYATEAEANAAWAALQSSATSLSNTGVPGTHFLQLMATAGAMFILGLTLVVWRRRKTY